MNGQNGHGVEPLLLSVDQAAHLLGIGRTLAYELARRGELPSVRFGKRVMVPRRAVVALVDAACVGTNENATPAPETRWVAS